MRHSASMSWLHHMGSNRCFSARQYLLCVSNGDTAVLHLALWRTATGDRFRGLAPGYLALSYQDNVLVPSGNKSHFLSQGWPTSNLQYGVSPSLGQIWDIDFTEPMLHINSLWPGDTIWRHGTRSTLDQVMACCLTAPSHYLNQCWLISKVEWH